MSDKATELLKKVRKIEIRTKALSHQIFAGEYHSAFKGRGMAFSEVREYRYGDDVRNMDWNVTARILFGTDRRTKRELLTEIAAVLSFSAILNNDKVGALFFSDRVEKFIPPKKGRSHLLHIIREMIDLEPASDGTDVGAALRFLAGAIKKKCTAFLLSDLLDVSPDGTPAYEEALKVAAGRHDLSVIKVHDPRERTLPAVGYIHVKDSESGRTAWINTDSRAVRGAYSRWYGKLDAEEQRMFNKYGIDNVDISTGSDYVKGLKELFAKR